MAIQLQPATIDDAQKVFAWRNDPWIVALGATAKTVSWEEHDRWFQEVVSGHRQKMFIVLYDDLPIGQVRFDRLNLDICEVSIYLNRDYTGKGFGVITLKKACEQIFRLWTINCIVAFIQRDNYPSQSAFQKVGFYPSQKYRKFSTNGCLQLCLERKDANST